MNKFIDSLKTGFADLKFVINDGKAKLLLPPVIAGVIVCVLIYVHNSMVQSSVGKQKSEIASLKTQREKMSGFTANKTRVFQLEKFFADPTNKNEWLVTQIIENFDNNNVGHTFTGSQTEDSTDNLIVTSIGVNFKTHYAGAVKLAMDLENAKTYTKIQEFLFSKDDRDAGSNLYSMKVSAGFLKPGAAAAPAAGGGK